MTAEPDLQHTSRSDSTRQVEQLVLLTLAIALAVVGFALSAVWIAAIVVLAVLWGYPASAVRATRAGGGVVSALVTTVVAEVRSVADEVASAGHEASDPAGGDARTLSNPGRLRAADAGPQ